MITVSLFHFVIPLIFNLKNNKINILYLGIFSYNFFRKIIIKYNLIININFYKRIRQSM
jgi:uncharacterized protein (UPF0262 family)